MIWMEQSRAGLEPAATAVMDRPRRFAARTRRLAQPQPDRCSDCGARLVASDAHFFTDGNGNVGCRCVNLPPAVWKHR
jgi:hypothetical protein